MEFALVLAFAGVAVTVLMVPGPDWAYVIATGTRDRVVAPAVLGLMGGYALLTTVVMLGVGGVVSRTPSLLTLVTLVGSSYIVWLGVRTLRSAAASPPGASDPVAAVAASGGPVPRRRTLVRGVGVSALNPNALLVFLAVLPQFVRPEATLPVTGQLGVLGLVYMMLVGVIYSSLGKLAERVLGRRAGSARIVNRLAGGVMVVLGTVMAGTQLAGL